ncbi:hypothetical protein SBOR_2144 [Sclerotinia borealis F-4128]|uniref:NAD-dependent 15-hydroxyprostaglandin dehydrogenase n=1 Tax=Sclerotinia borealis (strain F-4128) TaxID=1432307 RepID=W9CSI8_SCLBF|nr:hypothetical protein SBOR_2144 [Sclerotinia borealis F-4128]
MNSRFKLNASMDLEVVGKVAIITGAGSGISPILSLSTSPSYSNPHNKPTGISLALATLLLARGCNVVIADVALQPAATQLLHTYTKASPGDPSTSSSSSHPSSPSISSHPQCLYHPTDVTSWPALTQLFDYTLSHFPSGIDILVPGAGLFDPLSSNFYHPPGSPLSRDTHHLHSPSSAETANETLDSHLHSPSEIHATPGSYHTLNVNITHPIRLTQMGIEYWTREGRSGRVICLGSVAGQIGVMETPLYHASKFAVSGFVRSLCGLEDLGIRVVAIAPAVVQSPLWSHQPDKMRMLTSDQKWIAPETVAEAMVELLTQEKYVGGTILEVSGSGTRVVKMVGDEGPTFESGYMIGNLDGYKEEIYTKLREGRMGL